MRGFTALLILLIAGCATAVMAQGEKYEVRQVKIWVYDKSGQPWTDTTAFLGVRLDAANRQGLDENEISAGTINYSIGEEYKRFTLKLNEKGVAVADVAFVVHKDKDEGINYEMTLLKKEGEKYAAIALANRTIKVSRTSVDKIDARAQIFRPLMMSDWLLYGGIMLASILFIYFGVFRWLFSVLLFSNNWPVSRAEYFTTSLSLLLVMGVFGLLLVLFLPQTVVMWSVLGLLGVFWVGHAITWALS